MNNYTEYAGFGVAGNFALHLEQAGEIEDFKEVVTDDPNGPKGMFPFYIPGREGQIGVYPISSDTIILPKEECNVQPEPEVALMCDLQYDEAGNVERIVPRFFGAYNDCSLRKEGAAKISHKKNWGPSTKGLSQTLIPIDRFEEGGIMDRYRIASFLRRDGELIAYGEDVELPGYSYFYGKLLDWLASQINTQQNIGPLEPIGTYLREALSPKHAIISIGATRYSEFGETHFLKEGDEIVIAVYDGSVVTAESAAAALGAGEIPEGSSVLVQRVQRA